MIITKYYNSEGKLNLAKNKKDFDGDSTIRFKFLRGGKEFPCCDFEGKCTNKSHVEVYSMAMKNGKGGWSYLCKKHFKQEQKKFKGKLPYCLKVEW